MCAPTVDTGARGLPADLRALPFPKPEEVQRLHGGQDPAEDRRLEDRDRRLARIRRRHGSPGPRQNSLQWELRKRKTVLTFLTASIE